MFCLSHKSPSNDTVHIPIPQPSGRHQPKIQDHEHSACPVVSLFISHHSPVPHSTAQ